VIRDRVGDFAEVRTPGAAVFVTGVLAIFARRRSTVGIEAAGKTGTAILGAHREKKGMHSMAISTPVQA
jgi:hypothetical protein